MNEETRNIASLPKEAENMSTEIQAIRRWNEAPEISVVIFIGAGCASRKLSEQIRNCLDFFCFPREKSEREPERSENASNENVTK